MGQIGTQVKAVSDGSVSNLRPKIRSVFSKPLPRTAEAGLDAHGVLRGATLETYGTRASTISEEAYAQQQFKKASDARCPKSVHL
jgi:hypothetical protein